MKTLKEIGKIAKSMIEQDKNLKAYQKSYEQHSRLQWELPYPMYNFQWVRPLRTTGPYDAIRGAIRALSNLQERVTVEPVCVLKALGEEDDKSAAARKKANEWEIALQWALDKASKRQAGFRDTVIWNAVVYDEIIGQIIHLPTEFKARQTENSRKEAALRFGDWTIRLCDPKSVYIEYSEYMPERVLRVNIKTAQEVVDYWGDEKTGEIRSKMKKDDEFRTKQFFEFDYVDYETRLVWVTEAEHSDAATAAAETKNTYTMLGPEPWLIWEGKPVPFLPWVAVVGGTITDELPEFRRKPILFPIVQTELWANSNIEATIMMSQAIAEAAMPKQVITGPGAEDVEMDSMQPGGAVYLTAAQQYERIQNAGLDPQLRESFDRLEAAIAKSTVSEILVTGQPMGGVEAFAAYNLQVQTAIASLGAPRNLGERFYERLYETMLLITYYTGDKIEGYGDGLDKYVIDSEAIDPDNLYINVELKPDVPADRVQRVQAAIAMSQNLETPTRAILEWMGENNPEGLIEEYWIEQLNRADMMGRLERIRKQASGEIQEMAQMMLQQMMQEQQQMAQQQERVQGARPRTPEQMMGPQGIAGVEGQAWNPAMGMPAPATASPQGGTREFQRGLTRAETAVTELP